jgi:hypothetical protein
VRGVESVGYLYGGIKKQIQLERLATEAMLQSHAVEKLHDDECSPRVLANVMTRADVGVIERC